MSTTTAEVIVLRPPAPRLGNFDKIFSTYLEKISKTEPKIDGNAFLRFTLPDFDELWGLKNSKNGETTKTDKWTPERERLQKAAQSLFAGKLKEFVPSPPQVGHDGPHLPPVTPSNVLAPSHSKGFTSDTTQYTSSVFDSGLHTSSVDSTPLSSPDTIKYMSPGVYRQAPPSIECGDVFVGTPRRRYQASVVSTNVTGVAYSQITMIQPHQMAAPPNPVMDNISSDGTFRYNVAYNQSWSHAGITMYTPEFVRKGNNDCIKPAYMCSREEKMLVLQHKLAAQVVEDANRRICMPAVSNKVHIFVDLSNITIGFYDALKLSHNVPLNKRMKAPRFSFEGFARVLERGRDVEKRVVVGSLLSTYARKWPDYMQEGSQLGYEMKILQRVLKAASPVKKHRTVRRSNGEAEWTTSDGDSPDENAIIAGNLKQGEQGVDELLHLYMCQSALDSKQKPGTAVLATGDAAEADYSDGFKANCERLLELGWNVEIVGWSKGISKAWKETEFTQRWGDRVRIIELDPYVEELFGAWFGAPGY